MCKLPFFVKDSDGTRRIILSVVALCAELYIVEL